MHPSAGLKEYFDRRAAIMREAIAEVRKAKGQSATSKPAEKKEDAPGGRVEGRAQAARDQEVVSGAEEVGAPRYPRPEGSPGLGAGSGWES